MATRFRSLMVALCAILSLFVLHSCQKGNSAATTSSTTSSNYITVAADTTNPAKDSVDVMQSCGSGGYRDSIAFASLPAAVLSYLDSAYSGYTAGKAFTVQSSSGNVTGYVAVIYYNNAPVALEFDGNGTFKELLEFRHGRRHHDGSDSLDIG